MLPVCGFAACDVVNESGSVGVRQARSLAVIPITRATLKTSPQFSIEFTPSEFLINFFGIRHNKMLAIRY